MMGHVASLYRYPVKGFTPEALDAVALKIGEGVAFDRAFSVEDGPSGFDPSAPAHVSKMKFAVLAKIPAVALVRTRYDDAAGVLHAEAPGAAAIAADLSAEAGRDAFAAWLSGVLADHVRGPLKVLPAPGAHRFFDDPKGDLSLVNLESVRDLERRLGRPVDPLRFRANLYVEGWPAWSELEAQGRELVLGAARVRVWEPIRRCAATHVDPQIGVRDLALVPALHAQYGHMFCGMYLHVEKDGLIRPGDRAELIG